MAQPRRRVYRDYSFEDEESWTVDRQPPPSRRDDERIDSPQSTSQRVILDSGLDDSRLVSRAKDRPRDRLEYSIASMRDNDKDSPALHPGYTLAPTKEESFIDDDFSEDSDGEPIEPYFGYGRVSSSRPNGVLDKASTATPPDISRKVADRRPMSPISERSASPTATQSDECNTERKPKDGPKDQHRDSMENRVPEFFSMAIFRTALYNPTISHHLFKFGQLRLCSENMEFLQRAHKYQTMVNELSQVIVEIQEEFIVPSAQSELNVPEKVRGQTTKDIRAATSNTIPELEKLFRPLQTDLEIAVYRDVYPKFVRHQMNLSAAKALASNRGQYAGLGDCFVLTDPNRADNPIVSASDGFVRVTGYTRKEIIPRNCRFLQGQSTHQTSVRRLRKRIEKKEESVELLLNHKKNGEPFWNLLYTTPLFDSNGKLIYFFGGQINCSTTIHSSSDVLRILAQSKDSSEEQTQRHQSPKATKPPPGRKILSAFRSSNSAPVEQRAPGMEDALLTQIESQPWAKQADTFYTAYSNYVVINYSTYFIAFISSGLLDLLFPIKSAKSSSTTNTTNNATNKVNATNNYSNAVQLMPAAAAVGTDIFKFLANHGSGSIGWEFKQTVKNAVKAGNPVSLDMKLCARPYMGFEKFVLHWTPLKDESGSVMWIVLTLGSDRRS